MDVVDRVKSHIDPVDFEGANFSYKHHKGFFIKSVRSDPEGNIKIENGRLYDKSNPVTEDNDLQNVWNGFEDKSVTKNHQINTNLSIHEKATEEIKQ